MIFTSLNWFDGVALVLLVMIAWAGYRHGAAEELLPTVQWWTIVYTAARTHVPLGFMLNRSSGVNLASCYVAVYLCETAVITLVFVWLRSVLGGRIAAAQLFGKADAALGFILGIGKWAGILTFLVAVLNAYDMSPRRKWLQQHGDEPTFEALAIAISERIHRDIVLDSVSGRLLRQKVPWLLATPAPVSVGSSDGGRPLLERRRSIDQRVQPK
ncbi:MAG: CvpA family protein [Verrucomicrobiae bacterium]|nr:CvpA family protein [Verrucomicrobiae bacterium]